MDSLTNRRLTRLEDDVRALRSNIGRIPSRAPVAGAAQAGNPIKWLGSLTQPPTASSAGMLPDSCALWYWASSEAYDGDDQLWIMYVDGALAETYARLMFATSVDNPT